MFFLSSGTACLTLNICTSAKVPPKAQRNRSSSSCPGAQTLPRLDSPSVVTAYLTFNWYVLSLQVKKKMLYSSSFDALKKALVGVQKYIQATDLSEASRESVEEKLRATDRQ